MAFLTIKGNFEPMRSALTSIASLHNPGVLSEVLAAVGVKLATNTRHRMELGIDPTGARWADYAPLNPLYAQSKVGSGILIGRGGFASGLAGSITSQIEGGVLKIGTNKISGAIHQFGGVIKPKSKNMLVFPMGGHVIHAKSVTIPARPYLGISSEDVADIQDALGDFLRLSMNK